MVKHRRRIYYLKNTAQSKFVIRFVTSSLLGGIIAVCAFNYLSYKKIDSILYSMRMPKISPGGLLWNEMIYTNIFVIVLVLAVFIFLARGLYNRVHGPLRKLSSDISSIHAGNLHKNITLRKNDEFIDYAEALDQLVKTLNKNFKQLRNASDDISDKIADLAINNDQEAAKKAISSAIESMDDSLGSFKA